MLKTFGHKLNNLYAGNNLAKCLFLAGKYSENEYLALKFYKKALNLANRDKLKKCEVFFLIAQMYKRNQKYDEALKFFDLSLRLSLNLNLSKVIASTFCNIGEIYLDLGYYGQAYECFQNSLFITPNSKRKISYLGFKALALYYSGDYAESKDIFEEALSLCQIYNSDNLSGLIWGSLGNLCYETQDYDLAISYYKLAIKHNNSLLWLSNLAMVYLALKNTQKAFRLASTCLVHTDSNDYLKATIYDTIGQCYSECKKPKLALKFFKKAYLTGQKNKDNFGLGIYLSNIGHEYLNLNKLNLACLAYNKACRIYEFQRSKIRSDNLKTTFSLRGNDIYKNLIKIALKQNKRVLALELVEKSKARAMLDLLSNSPIDIIDLKNDENLAIQNLVDEEKKLRDKISYLEKIYARSVNNNDSLRTGHNYSKISQDRKTLTKKYKQILQLLYMLHPNYASMISQKSLNFAEIKKLWPDYISVKSAIIQFYLEPDLFTISLLILDL